MTENDPDPHEPDEGQGRSVLGGSEVPEAGAATASAGGDPSEDADSSASEGDTGATSDQDPAEDGDSSATTGDDKS